MPHMLYVVLLIVVVVALIGSLPAWPWSSGWGPYPAGGIGALLLLIIIVLILSGRP